MVEAEALAPPSGDRPSVPVTVNEVSPTVAGELTLKKVDLPAPDGTSDAGKKDPVNPDIESAIEGIVPVEPLVKVSVTVYEPCPPLRIVSGIASAEDNVAVKS